MSGGGRGMGVQVRVIYEQGYLLSGQRLCIKCKPPKGSIVSKLRHKHYTDMAQNQLVGETRLRFESKC